jgi:16S rRNA G527 N7-methylase RsmG
MERIHDVLHQATELQKVYPHFIDALVQKGRKRSHGMAEAGQALIEIGSGVGYPEIVL